MKLKNILLTLFKPNKYTYLFYALSIIVLSVSLYLYISSTAVALTSIGLIIIAFELGFRYSYKKFYGKSLPEKFPITSKDIPIEEHPYLPWVYKKNYNPPENKKIYGEERQGFMLGGFKTNNLRHINGPEGGRDVLIPKPEGIYRILCLGDSTTCNYVRTTNDQFISWPLKLEEKLKDLNKNIELNNCGQGGYNTNEILIKFLIDTIDTNPDMVILYHAFVNIRGYLTNNFERDFYHFRKTMSSTYPQKLRIASYIPTFGLWSLRFLLGEYLSYLNIKEDHIRQINRNDTINRDKEPEGLETFERNIENLIHVCKGRNIQLILSTYCYHLYDAIKDSPIHIKFCDTVQKENQIIRTLASKYSLPLVENQALVPPDDRHFLDEVHPTELGMEAMAKNFYNTIQPLI
jgi:lysophospholipase L1-like esterase